MNKPSQKLHSIIQNNLDRIILITFTITMFALIAYVL